MRLPGDFFTGILLQTKKNKNNNMGVKAIKQKYNIEHIVQKEGDTIWIGSSYIHYIIGVSSEGKLTKLYKDRKYDDGWSTNEDLKRYQEEMLVDQASGELKRLVQLVDEVKDPITVYTYNGCRVVKTFCEKTGWPNTTITGELMYNNTYFLTYREAYEALLRNTKLKYSWVNWKQNMSDSFKKMKNTTAYFLGDVFEYLYARTVQRLTWRP